MIYGANQSDTPFWVLSCIFVMTHKLFWVLFLILLWHTNFPNFFSLICVMTNTLFWVLFFNFREQGRLEKIWIEMKWKLNKDIKTNIILFENVFISYSCCVFFFCVTRYLCVPMNHLGSIYFGILHNYMMIRVNLNFLEVSLTDLRVQRLRLS